MKRLLSLSLKALCFAFLFVCINAYAADNEVKTILILNSYSENSPWAKTVLNPVTNYAAQMDHVHVEMMNLNSTLITDSTTYNLVRENVFKVYDKRKVDYIVFIGNLAFTLRDEVKNKWGDIPMLLITRDLTLSYDDSFYFSGFDREVQTGDLSKMSDLIPEYNFTVVYVPDLYKETIDMMVQLNPDMDQFVYFSDAIYFNRYLAYDVENYLLSEYPEISFRWAKASFENAEELQYYLVTRKPNAGLLLSSWSYKQDGALGYPTLVSGDIALLYSSINPVFSLRSSYMTMGSVGGVYNDYDKIADAIVSDLDAMISGQQMRDIKFFIDRSHGTPTINYPVFKEYSLKISDCPKGTVFIDKPQTLWEKYHWYLLLTLALVVTIIVLLSRRNASQRREIELLSRHKQFVENMPIPYTKAKVIYDDKHNMVSNIKYTISNQAFDDIVRENSNTSGDYVLFTPDFISEKTSEMIDAGHPVSFLKHFERTGKYFIFTICLVGYFKKKDRDIIETIDIFAIDVTDRMKAEDDLKDITQRLDMTINVANLIPWDWDMKTDVMTFDAYSLFERYNRNFNDAMIDQTSHITVGEYMRLVHPDDREILRDLREKLFLNQISKFSAEYRVIVARQNKETIEWVEIKGDVAKRDAEGKPIYVMGAMSLITDRKQQECDLAEARKSSDEAHGIKASFISNLSHEVRVQLNAIVGFASLMCETDELDKRREFADIISKNNNELLDYIDNLAEESDSSSPKPYSADSKPTKSAAANDTQAQSYSIASAQPNASVAADNKPTVNLGAVKPDIALDKAPEKAPVQKGRNSGKKLILVAEDIEGNFLLLKHFIPKEYEIEHAWTGKEAVEMFRQRRPDIVLMDIGMPVMDGYKATSEIRKVDTEVPIVAVTAFTYASDRELILNSGFDDYISKPVARELLLDALKRYA